MASNVLGGFLKGLGGGIIDAARLSMMLRQAAAERDAAERRWQLEHALRQEELEANREYRQQSLAQDQRQFEGREERERMEFEGGLKDRFEDRQAGLTTATMANYGRQRILGSPQSFRQAGKTAEVTGEDPLENLARTVGSGNLDMTRPADLGEGFMYMPEPQNVSVSHSYSHPDERALAMTEQARLEDLYSAAVRDYNSAQMDYHRSLRENQAQPDLIEASRANFNRAREMLMIARSRINQRPMPQGGQPQVPTTGTSSSITIPGRQGGTTSTTVRGPAGVILPPRR